ncbi:MAG: hypothetical protein LBG90_07040 [Spirochaetaceae bacterium]|jgi:chromosome segregation ATPase|nr:hypothetical protein [Spirochaetaceae bacterium]
MDIFSEIFSLGNIATLGIVGMVLFLYRQIDKHSQSMQKIQQYATELKEELTEFVAEKEGAVKDYSISLDVQQKAAKELMRRLQITDEELAAKAAAVTRIDERLNGYDVSLKELIEMSVRVQENLNRIREESVFVEKVNKRVADSKEKFEALEQGLAEVEQRFAAENAAALEDIARQVLASAADQVNTLRSDAEQAERRIAEGKEAIEQAEQSRIERIDRDMNFISRSLNDALEQAAVRADNMENAALLKLREQAVERIEMLQTAIEKDLDAHLEYARTQLKETQKLVTDCKESWKTDASELENQQNLFKEEWNRDLQDLQERLEAQRSSWEMTVESENERMKRFLEDLKNIADESRENTTAQTAMLEEHIAEVKKSADSRIEDLEKRFADRMQTLDRQILEANEERIASWNKLTMEGDAKTRQVLADLEAASGEIKTHFTAETDAMEQRLRDLEENIDASLGALRNQIGTEGKTIEERISQNAADRFEQWNQRVEERDAASSRILEEMQTSLGAFKTEFGGETQRITEKLNKLREDMDENIQQMQDTMLNAAAETQGRIAEEMTAGLDRWKEAAAEGDERSRQLLRDLENAGAETEKYMANEIEQMNHRLDGIQTKIDELIGHIENEVSEAEERALAIADSELEKWKQAVEEAEGKAKQIISVLETSLEDTQNQISREIAGAGKQIEGLKSKLDATSSHIEVELVNAVASAKEEGLLRADEELERWKQAVETQNGLAKDLLANIETAADEAKQQASEGIAEITERLEALQTKLDETAGHIESELTQAWDNAHDQASAAAETELERWKQAVETEEVKVQNVLASLELSLTDTKERISQEILGGTGQINALQTELNEAAAHIEDRIRTAIASAQELASAEAAGELDKWKAAAEERDAQVRAALADLEAALASAEAQAAEIADAKLSQWKQHLETKDAEIRKGLAGIETFFTAELDKWKQTVETEDAQLRSQLAELETSLEDTELEITSEIANAQGRIEHLQSKIDETCDTIESTMTNTLQSAEKRAAETASQELAKWKQTVETEDAQLRSQLAELETSLETSKRRISEEIRETAGQFEELQTKINDTASRAEQIINEGLGSAEKRAEMAWTSALETWKQTILAEEEKVRALLDRIAEESARAEGRFDEAQTQITAAADRIASTMENAVRDAEEKAQSLSNRGLERWKETAEEGDRKARQLLGELEAAYAENEGRFDGIQSKIQETADQIEELLTRAAAEAEEKAQSLSDQGLERWKQAGETGEAQARQLLAELERVSRETKQRVFDEIAEAQRQFETLRGNLETLRANIENQMLQTVKSGEEKAAALAGAGLEQWKLSMDAENERTRSLLRELQDASAESAVSLAELEDRLRRGREDLERAGAEENARRLEAWKQAASAEDAEIRRVMAETEAFCAEAERRITAGLASEEERFTGIEDRLNQAQALLENEMALAVVKAKEKALSAAGEEEAKMRRQFAELESAFGNLRNQLFQDLESAESRLAEVGTKIDDTASRVAGELAEAAAAAEERAKGLAGEELAKWNAQIEALGQNLAEARQEAERAGADLRTRLEHQARETEQQALQALDARFEQWKSISEAEEAKAQGLLSSLDESSSAMEQRIAALGSHFDDAMAALETSLRSAADSVERRILEETEAKFEEYQTAQGEHFKRLETLADDASGLDAELRRYMSGIEQRLQDDISRFESDSAEAREKAVSAFETALEALKTGMNDAEQDLAVLKSQAYQNVAEQFQRFEDDFAKDLGKRSEDIGQWLKEWQESQHVKITGFIQDADAQYKQKEQTLHEELRGAFAEQKKALLSELESVKTEADGFETDLRSRMQSAGDSLDALQAQIQQSLETSRASAEASAKAEIERYERSITEQIQHSQSGLEERINAVAEKIEAQNQEIANKLEGSRQDLDKRQTEFAQELQELDGSLSEARKRSAELLAESEERLKAFRSAINDADKDADTHRAEVFARISEDVKTLDSAIKEADRRIKEFASQTRLFERTDELKVELERRLAELQGDYDRIDQRRLEAMDLEGQLVKIKRLEDEVNAKMTRFLTEKHRIEQMETEFNRLLQVSAAVEEKLTEVSDSDDTLQQIQIQIRKLNDALVDTEEKYQRIEKKNQTLDATNDGIDRNFKSLQESEKISRHITDEVSGLSAEIGSLRSAVASLTEENTRAREVADKLSLLDTALSTVEERIKDMQKAREWLARAETRLEDLNKQMLDQVKLMDAPRNTDKVFDDDKGAPSLGVRDNIIRLARQGWKVDEIARAVKRSKGEVELVLEIMPKE